MWMDLLKYAPGWLAFGLAGWAFMQQRRSSKRVVAIGPANDIRRNLYLLRSQFENRRVAWNWSDIDAFREVMQDLWDLAERVGDDELRDNLEKAISDWVQYVFFVYVAHMQAWWMGLGSPNTPTILKVFIRDNEAAVFYAIRGMRSTEDAIDSLNRLEKKISGRM